MLSGSKLPKSAVRGVSVKFVHAALSGFSRSRCSGFRLTRRGTCGLRPQRRSPRFARVRSTLSDRMEFKKIIYSDLNSRQKEIYNFQKIAGILADYGFNCIKLADDWLGADFLAYHKDGKDTLRVQLKSRLTIDKKYLGKELHMAFPVLNGWCLIAHDELVSLVSTNTNWLNTESWQQKGLYHSIAPSQKLLEAIKPNVVENT